MHPDKNYIWSRVNALFERYAARVKAIDASLLERIVVRSIDAAFLKGHLSFRNNYYGDELMIHVDVKCRGDCLAISCDITDDALVLAQGPSATISLSAEEDAPREFEEWLVRFETFLGVQEGTVVRVAAGLK